VIRVRTRSRSRPRRGALTARHARLVVREPERIERDDVRAGRDESVELAFRTRFRSRGKRGRPEGGDQQQGTKVARRARHGELRGTWALRVLGTRLPGSILSCPRKRFTSGLQTRVRRRRACRTVPFWHARTGGLRREGDRRQCNSRNTRFELALAAALAAALSLPALAETKSHSRLHRSKRRRRRNRRDARRPKGGVTTRGPQQGRGRTQRQDRPPVQRASDD
jgi:hypothetical protein